MRALIMTLLKTSLTAGSKQTRLQKAAKGFILLRITESVASQIRSLGTAKAMWDTLVTAYGKPGLQTIYSEFKKMTLISFPENRDPTVPLGSDACAL